MKSTWLSGRRRWAATTAGLLATLLLTLGGTASAQTVTGIAATKHNLGSGPGLAGRNQVSAADTAEICVFCHTPHGASTDAPAPLWNKRLGTNGAPAGGGSYTTYDTLQTPSLDGTVAPVGSVSMACLSCHDGTQAMDNIINAPGSGGYDTTGGGADGRTYTWSGSSVNAAGRLTSASVAMLDTNLSNDHPIGIQYCGGGLSGSGQTIQGTCKDTDFKAPKTDVINSRQVFWVDTGGAGMQRTDLPLYVRNDANSTLGPLVECASCHDPHVSKDQAGPTGTNQVAGDTFLRISNASSAVCTACHVK